MSYSHPSMPGTPRDFPEHITASPERTPSWHDTCASPARNFAGETILTQMPPSESPECSSSSESSSL